MSLVKLYLYQHEREKTVVHSFNAKEWSDFLIITLDGVTTQEEYEQFAEIVREYSQKMSKEIIVVPAGWDLEIYGVTDNVEERPQSTVVVGEADSPSV